MKKIKLVPSQENKLQYNAELGAYTNEAQTIFFYDKEETGEWATSHNREGKKVKVWISKK